MNGIRGLGWAGEEWIVGDAVGEGGSVSGRKEKRGSLVTVLDRYMILLRFISLKFYFHPFPPIPFIKPH